MIPIVRFGLAIMSIGFLVEEDTAMIWRGPMVMSAITQMLRDVAWGTLDILVVDMLPVPGDAQLTLAQNVPLKGAIIISTPQDLSLIDARRGLAMFKKVNVPVLGHCREHELFPVPALRYAFRTSSATAERGTRRSGLPCRFWARFRCTCRFGSPRIPGRRWWRASPMPARGNLPRDRCQGPRPAPRRHRRGLSLFSGGMRLSFNQCCHAFCCVFATELPC